MKQLKSALLGFLEGEVDLDDVSQEIKRLAKDEPDAINEALALLKQLHDRGALGENTYQVFKSHLQHPPEAATNLAQKKPSEPRIGDSSIPAHPKTDTEIADSSLLSSIIAETTGSHQATDHPAASTEFDPNNQSSGTPLGIGSILKQRFVLEKVLGRGGMGIVYKALDQRKEEAKDREPYIAVKVLSEQFQTYPISFIALQREAKKAQKLAHPNIVTVYDFDRDQNNVFMTMEYLEGEPLDKLIKRTRPKLLEKDKALLYIEQMSRALTYAHEQRIVHSDFKPGNVFITKSGVAKVLDFGIASALKRPDKQDQDATAFDPKSLGALTPAYASCEMLENKEPDPRDDVYGLSVVAYLLLTGHHPFNLLPATAARAAGKRPAHLQKLPRECRTPLLKGLEFKRSKRIPNAAIFLDEIIRIRRAKKSNQRHLMLSGIAFILAIPLLYFGFSQLEKRKEIQPPTENQWVDTSELEPATRQKVERLLEVARVHILVGRLVEPPSSSALTAYQQILDLHANNRQAKIGLQRLGDHYYEQANKARNEGDRVRFELSLQKGLVAAPDHGGLLKLRDGATGSSLD